jgi:hypothetical protein
VLAPLGALIPVDPPGGISEVLEGAVVGDGGAIVPVNVSAPNACEGPNPDTPDGAGRTSAVLGAVVGASVGAPTLIALFAAVRAGVAAPTSFPGLLL